MVVLSACTVSIDVQVMGTITVCTGAHCSEPEEVGQGQKVLNQSLTFQFSQVKLISSLTC